MAKTESRQLRELMTPLLARGERILAEGRAQTDEIGDRSYLIVTDRRILWRHVGAALDTTRFPLRELSFKSLQGARDRHARGRSHLELIAEGVREVFEFNRVDASAAVAIREKIRELEVPFQIIFERSPDQE